MTVSAQTPINRSTANGVTTVFPYDFKILAAADLEVSLDGVVKTLTTDYTLSGVGDYAGGNVTMLSAPANGAIVVRRRNMAYTREVDYQDQGELPTDTLDDDQDAPILMIQQVAEGLSRAVSLPPESSGVSLELPTPGALQYLRWNAAADALESVLLADVSLISLTAYAQTLLNAVDAAAARLVLGITTFGSSLVTAANAAAARIAMGAAAVNFTTIYTTGGTSTAYTLTPTPALTALAAGQRFSVAFNATNTTTTPTLAISGLTAKSIKLLSNAGAKVDPLVGQIPAGAGFDILYDGTDYILTGIRGYAAGDVIQVQSFASDAGGSVTAVTTINTSASNHWITPRSTNSIIVVMCTFQGRSALLAATNTIASFQLMESGVAFGDQNSIAVSTGSGGNSSEAPAAITGRVANSAQSSRSFTLGAATSNAGSAATASKQMFTITEIQQ